MPGLSKKDIEQGLRDFSSGVIMPDREDMTREEFRNAVFERDRHLCVVCDQPAVDAHHLIERRLWPDGGYELDNGVSLCEEHHLDAERTVLSVDTLRELAGITYRALPETMEREHEYDKWGNIILPDGRRMIGPLFYDESVQKILPEEIKSKFTRFVKYPRTPYVHWSPGLSDDSLLLVDPDEMFTRQQRVIITEKMDGENTTMYSDYIHARSLDSGYHASRTWVKNFWSQIAHNFPGPGERISGENMYAKHSIKYENLPSYFLGFSMWNQDGCYDWDNTMEWFSLIGITPVPVLFDGKWYAAKDKLESIEAEIGVTKEGYVIRAANSFLLKDFQKNVAKYVRKDHIQTTSHWKQGGFEVNGLDQ